MRLVRHKGHQPTHTQHKPGVLSPLTETPAHVLNWSMACRNWSLGVSFSSAPSLASEPCRVLRGLHPWDTEHYQPFQQTRTAKRWSLNECTVKLSSTPSVVRTVRIEYRHGWGELPPNVQTFSIKIFLIFVSKTPSKIDGFDNEIPNIFSKIWCSGVLNASRPSPLL